MYRSKFDLARCQVYIYTCPQSNLLTTVETDYMYLMTHEANFSQGYFSNQNHLTSHVLVIKYMYHDPIFIFHVLVSSDSPLMTISGRNIVIHTNKSNSQTLCYSKEYICSTNYPHIEDRQQNT